MNFNEYQPIYIQIMDKVKAEIIKGDLESNEKLPPVREVAVDLKVNPNTVQRSYQELEREGIIMTQRGVGSFVTEDRDLIKSMRKDMAKSLVDNFIKDMVNLGFEKSEIVEIINDRGE